MEVKKGRVIKRKPLSDTTNCPTATPPPPIRAAAALVTSTTNNRRRPNPVEKPQFETSSVGSNSSSRRGEDEDRPPAPTTSPFASPASLIDESERVYKRRCSDRQRWSIMDPLSCPAAIRKGGMQRRNQGRPCEPGSSRMQASIAYIMKQQHHEIETSSEHGRSRMCRSVPAMIKQQKRRYSMPEIPTHTTLPEDYVEEQKARFAEIDAFELQEEEVVSYDELD